MSTLAIGSIDSMTLLIECKGCFIISAGWDHYIQGGTVIEKMKLRYCIAGSSRGS